MRLRSLTRRRILLASGATIATGLTARSVVTSRPIGVYAKDKVFADIIHTSIVKYWADADHHDGQSTTTNSSGSC